MEMKLTTFGETKLLELIGQSFTINTEFCGWAKNEGKSSNACFDISNLCTENKWKGHPHGNQNLPNLASAVSLWTLSYWKQCLNNSACDLFNLRYLRQFPPQQDFEELERTTISFSQKSKETGIHENRFGGISVYQSRERADFSQNPIRAVKATTETEALKHTRNS